MMREQCARSVLSDLLMVLVCLLTYVIDLIVSAFLVAKYLKNSNEVIAILVTVLLLLPGVMTSILSCCWLLKDPPYRKMLPNRFHVVRTLSIIFLVSPLSGYINSLYFLLQRYQTRSNGEVAALQRVTDAMVGCVCEVTLLRLFQSVLSTTPSSVLEFYLLLKHNHRLEGMLEKVGVVTALISISVSLTAYTGTFRRSRQYEGMNPFYIDAVLFLINLFNISARVLAISLFATISWQYTGVVCAIHWLVMTLWLLLPISKSTFRVDKLLDSFVLATAYIFVFIHDENNRTLYKYLFYYTMCLVGNTSMLIMWLKHSDFVSSVSIYSAFIGHYVLFLSGVLLLIAYHTKCRPQVQKDCYAVDIQLNERRVCQYVPTPQS